MVVGQYKIGAIIQARLGSTRLPNKVLMPLPMNSNETIISNVINSLVPIKRIDEIIVATSDSYINNKLESYISTYNVSCFRGKEEDVLSRFYHIVKLHQLDYVIRFTADNPIVDQKYLNEFISNFLNKDLDYSYSQNLPIGCNFEMMKSSEIILAFNSTISAFDKEHVTPFIRKNAKNVEFFQFKNSNTKHDLRLTIDYPSDYAFMQIIFAKLGNMPKTIKNINDLIDDNLWVLDINNANFQKKEFHSLEEEVANILPVIKERKLNRLEKLLKNV